MGSFKVFRIENGKARHSLSAGALSLAWLPFETATSLKKKHFRFLRTILTDSLQQF